MTWDSQSVVGSLGFVRILSAPLLALAFALAGLFAPNRVARFAFFGATALEVTSFAFWVISCLLRNY